MGHKTCSGYPFWRDRSSTRHLCSLSNLPEEVVKATLPLSFTEVGLDDVFAMGVAKEFQVDTT